MLKLKRVVESQGNGFSWKDPKVQNEITNAVYGIQIDKSKTTDKELIFVHNGKNGSLHLQGYMLVLDTDTDDGIPPISYPVKDLIAFNVDNLIDTIKVVFSRKESLCKAKDDTKNVKESKEVVEKRIDEEERAVCDDADSECFSDKGDRCDVCGVTLDMPTVVSSPVFQDVAKERLVDKIGKSLILAPPYNGECAIKPEECKEIVWVYLTPSYSIEPQDDIVVPIRLKDRMVSMPVADMPDPTAVFGGEEVEDPIGAYRSSVQGYLVNDVPMSDVIKLDIDNADEVKGSLVSLVNSMAEDYLAKKMSVEDGLDTNGEDLLSESRYFIVPEGTDPLDNVTFITPLGYTDLTIAKNDLNNMVESGNYADGLSILDTNFSRNKNKWRIL